MFRFHILGLLRKGEALHGYALMKEHNRRTGRNYGAGYFYRQLAELMSEGLVQVASNPQGADTRRTPYEITSDGLEAFDQWFEDIPSEPLDSDVDQIARAMFFSDVEPDVGARVLAVWQRDLLHKAKVLERELHHVRARRTDLADMRPMLVRRDLLRIAADLEFLDEVGETINERRRQLNAQPVAEAPEAKPVRRLRKRAAGAG